MGRILYRPYLFRINTRAEPKQIYPVYIIQIYSASNRSAASRKITLSLKHQFAHVRVYFTCRDYRNNFKFYLFAKELKIDGKLRQELGERAIARRICSKNGIASKL